MQTCSVIERRTAERVGVQQKAQAILLIYLDDAIITIITIMAQSMFKRPKTSSGTSLRPGLAIIHLFIILVQFGTKGKEEVGGQVGSITSICPSGLIQQSCQADPNLNCLIGGPMEKTAA